MDVGEEEDSRKQSPECRVQEYFHSEDKNVLGKVSMTKWYCRLSQEVQVGGIKNLLLATLQRSFMTVTKGRTWLTVCTARTFPNYTAYAVCYFFFYLFYASQ